MKIVQKRVISQNEFGYSIDYRITAKLNRLENKNPKGTFKRHFGHGVPCGHDYDCCGCWHTYVWTHKMVQIGPTPNKYSIEIHRFMNV